MWSMYLFFVHSYEASKMEEKVTMWLKNRFSDHWLMVRLNLCSHDKRNCKKATFIKERNPQFGIQKRTFIWKIKTVGQVTASKTCKSVRKVSKTRRGYKF